jgi:leader peptidase (prepilin peptidase)/N-methyltransferase
MELLFNIIVFILGASIGSFLNVLIDRLPNDLTILGRSKCDYCGKKIAWFDLFPVISYVILGGKCRYCHKKLSLQYPLIEIVTGVIFMLVYLSSQGFSYFQLFALLGIMSSLIVIFVSDLKYHLISDFLLMSFAVFSLLFHISNSLPGQSILGEYVASALIVSLPIFLIYFLSHEKAMGLGDVYLTAILGFLLGWKAGFLALYIAFVTGAIIGIGMMVAHKKKIKSRIPFGPFLVTGTILMIFWGDKALEVIKSIYGF